MFILLSFQNNHFLSFSSPDITSRFRLERLTDATGSTSGSVTNQPLQSVRFLAAELVLGLLFLHENGIVHQDIKPANLMISPAGHAIITDFGSASVLPRLSPPTPASSESRIYGPVVKRPEDGTITFNDGPYAAPELSETTNGGMLEYDERVDFYSLAVVLYECATGSLPFGGEGGVRVDKGWDVPFEMLVKQVSGGLPFPNAGG
jgi:serine/threonine protein kinase